MLKRANHADVKVLPGLFRSRMELNRQYLMELDSTCLLQNFYLEAGVILPGLQVVDDPAAAKLHWGWEAPNCQLRGHFLGHWMSAAAALSSGEQDEPLKAKLTGIVHELARCQQLNGGEWVGSIPEKYFEMLAEGKYVWSPQYTMHKTIMGLADTYRFLRLPEALEVVDHLANWYVRWVDEMNRRNPAAVYSGEQAGMLEMWAELLAVTGSAKYEKLVRAYENNALFTKLDAGEDPLTDDHANASIPLAHGAARLYEVTGDDKWRSRTLAFWQKAVDERGMYCTTGSNAGEFWIPPHRHGSYLGQRDQEFCTVYNMVRLAEYLYRWTGEREYADYIEKALYNGFLAQQNRLTGMPAYFLPMEPGSRKKWGSRTRDFWCCHGTMVQAQTLYPDLIWYTESDGIRVSQYIPSEAVISLEQGTVEIRQNMNMKSYNSQTLFDEHSDGRVSRWSLIFHVKTQITAPWTLRLRVPSWSKGEPRLVLNSVPAEYALTDGWAEITRTWNDDTLQVVFEDEIREEPLPGLPECAAWVAGPVVLAGLTETDQPVSGKPEEILIPKMEHTYADFLWQQDCYRTRRQHPNFSLIPLYDVLDEPYTVYFTHEGAEAHDGEH